MLSPFFREKRALRKTKEFKVDIDRLRELAVSKHGLVNEDLRKLAWPILLNAEVLADRQASEGDILKTTQSLRTDTSWQSHGKKTHRESGQIAKDVNRSLNVFEECREWNKTLKMVRRAELSKLMHAILNQNPSLSYYQGYHDFISVFMLTLGENLGFHCGQIASKFLIKDFMREDFDLGVMPALDLSNKLLELEDLDLFNLIEQGGGQPTFAVSWILTWFAHDVESLSAVQLIFDACLATHPLFCVYISVAQIILCKKALLEQEMPEISGFIVFKEIRESQGFKIQESILLAKSLFDKHPPDTVTKLI